MIETFHKWINSFGVPYNTDESGTITWDNLENKTVPTKAEIDAKKIELTTEFNAQAYARARKSLYPDIGDQLDALYHAGAFPADMAAKLKKVKDDNPKG